MKHETGTIWLDNPGGTPRRRHKHRTNRKRKASAAQLRARQRFAALARAGKLRKGIRLSTSKARTRAAVTRNAPREETTMAKRKRRRARAGGAKRRRPNLVRRRSRRKHHRVNARRARSARRPVARNPRRRRHHHRRNPGNIRGIVSQVVDAGKSTVAVIVGRAATNRISALVPIGGTSVPVTVAKQVLVGVGLAMLARKFAPKYQREVLIGALLVPTSTLLAQIPVVGPLLAGAPPGLGLYARANGSRIVQFQGAPPGLGRLGRVGLYPQNDIGRGTKMSGYVQAMSGGRGAYYD